MKLVEQLAFTLKPRLSPAGKVEKAIDKLIDARSEFEYYSINGPRWIWDFDSLPVLFEHFQDRRLTRNLKFHLGGGYTHITVGDACQRIAWDLLGQPLTISDIRTANCTEFLENIRTTGEEKWCMKHLDNILFFVISGRLNPALLAIVREKYPQQLITVLNAHESNDEDWCLNYELLDSILQSQLPKPVKQACLDRILYSKSIKTRWAGYSLLSRYSPRELKAQLPNLLCAIDADGMQSEEAKYVFCQLFPLIGSFEDEELWQTYTAMSSKLSGDDKSKLLCQTESLWQDRIPGYRRGPLLFLQQMLEDCSTIEAVNQLSNFPFSNLLVYPRFRVQDLAAIHIGWIFDLDVPLNRDRTDEEWAIIHQQMAALLQNRLKELNAKSP